MEHMGKVFETEYAGHKLKFSFVHPSTRLFFDPSLRPVEGEADICSSEERIERARSELPPEAKIGYVENQTLIGLTGKRLLRYDSSIFHAVAFLWKEKAYLLTAPSGTGKSTQYFNWQSQFPGEIAMICGDMPVLERRRDGSVWVHPSNWNGKENIGGKDCGILAGIVLLEQGKENRISRLSVGEALLPVFRQFVVFPDTVEEIEALGRLLDGLFRQAACWKLVNRGDASSTALLRETLITSGKGGASIEWNVM